MELAAGEDGAQFLFGLQLRLQVSHGRVLSLALHLCLTQILIFFFSLLLIYLRSLEVHTPRELLQLVCLSVHFTNLFPLILHWRGFNPLGVAQVGECLGTSSYWFRGGYLVGDLRNGHRDFVSYAIDLVDAPLEGLLGFGELALRTVSAVLGNRRRTPQLLFHLLTNYKLYS